MFRALHLLPSSSSSSSSSTTSPISSSLDSSTPSSTKDKTTPQNRAFTVTVGPPSKTTWADWHLPEPADVIRIVGQLSEGDSTSTSSTSNL